MIQLADYQKEAENWLLAHPFGVLADAPGVGKTHSAIFAARRFPGRKMIIVPAYLISNWLYELERSGVKGTAMVGDVNKRKQIYNSDPEWLLMSYETFSADYEDLKGKRLLTFSKRQWGVVIFDEAHRLRGRDSKRTEAAFQIRKYANHVWMLTGTPLVSDGGNVFPLLKICDPQTFTSYWRFVEDNCYVAYTPWAKKVGKPRNREAFNKLLQPYMFRRRLEDVLPSIPDVIEKTITVDLSNAARKEYHQIKTEYKITNPDGEQTRIGAGGLISNLRRTIASEKMPALNGIIEDIPGEEQIVIFTWHREAVETVLEDYNGKGDTIRGFTGEMSIARRQEIIKDFQDGKFRILVATLATMQEGVNLQNASRVIFFEEDWLATTNEQAVARLRRRGQERTVIKYVLMVRKTIDTSIHRIQAKRGQMDLGTVFDSIWKEEE